MAFVKFGTEESMNKALALNGNEF